MKKIIVDWFGPFEVLYIAISISTFSHTAWAASYLFEGKTNEGEFIWYTKGYLIAFAIDIGLLIISRFLQNSDDIGQTATLIMSFVLASFASFYCQMAYIVFHTPQFVISSGVSSYWVATLTPILDARVIIFPASLPILATAFTLSRIYRHKHAVKISNSQVEIDGTGDIHGDFGTLIEIVASAPLELPINKRHIELPSARVDLDGMTFWTEITGKVHGPYKTRNRMLSAMNRVNQKVLLLPERVEDGNEN